MGLKSFRLLELTSKKPTLRPIWSPSLKLEISVLHVLVMLCLPGSVSAALRQLAAYKQLFNSFRDFRDILGLGRSSWFATIFSGSSLIHSRCAEFDFFLKTRTGARRRARNYDSAVCVKWLKSRTLDNGGRFFH